MPNDATSDNQLTELEREAETWETRVTELEEKLQIARSHLHNVRMKIAQYSNNRSPILRLPREITALIFGVLKCRRQYRSRVLPPVVILTHVCSEWRTIAVNKATVWTMIQWDYREGNAAVAGADLVNSFLARSGAADLQVEIDCRASEPPRTLIDQLHRFSTLAYVADPIDGIPHSVTEFFGASAVRLRSLDLNITCESHLSLVIFPGGVPALTELKLYSISITSCIAPLSLLQSLELNANDCDPISIIDFKRAISAIIALRSLTIEWQAIYASNDVKCFLPTLTELAFRLSPESDGFYLPQITEVLVTPFVHTLRLYASLEQSLQDFSDHLHARTSLLYPKLEHLIVNDAVPLKLMHAFPTVKRLSFTPELQFNDRAMELQLVLPLLCGMPMTAFPYLQTLVIDQVDFGSESEVAIRTLVSSRLEALSPFSTLIIRCTEVAEGFPTEDFLSWVYERVRMELYLSSASSRRPSP